MRDQKESKSETDTQKESEKPIVSTGLVNLKF